ncbi:hypothetical protein [Sporosarcina limicola]|uniref:Uncharacterized protein n=1 Tax=Sporosarcina limicola TaxID=34101 RepID=A0A927MLX7_9BACL|nr:hypothetical protein [Sporosarcina limicola]MBE1557003.1 hypothetical protein [Sporosarcina limicola]
MEGLNEWQLSHLSQALTRAKRLEKQRADFHQELYDTVLYPTVHYDKEFTGNGGSPVTDIQAIKIIEAKERYERLIQKEYKAHRRWESVLEWIDERDRPITIRYFAKGKRVQLKIIGRLLQQITKQLEREEQHTERQRNEQSTADYKEVSATNTSVQEASEAIRTNS